MYTAFSMRRFAILLLIVFASCDVKPAPGPAAGGGTRDPFGRGAASTSTAAIDYGARRALVVGVTNYASATVGDLDGPAYDAADVAATLATRFGFQVELALDRAAPMALPDGVQVGTSDVLTRERLSARIDALRESAGPRDALLFYFAGHGLPDRLLPGDAELPKADDPASWRNVLAVAEAAATLRRADAHHTILILDCCFSGAALREGSPLRGALSPLGPSVVRASEQENLGRVFNRRAFQILTAGAGDETVADMAQAAATYAALPKDLEGHSPFTGVLLQALRGLAGRPDGIVPASDLGYYVAHTLVNENRSFRAKQAPRFASLAGGEGDFLFLPVRPVLNPKLVSPLYMAGPEYAELRGSAAAALVRFVAEQPKAHELGRSAIPHVTRLLRDPQPGPRTAAAKALADLAALGEAPEFAPAIGPLVELLPDAEAARALGALASWADEASVAAMAKHLEKLQARWEGRIQKRRPPEEVARRMEAAPPASAAGAKPAEAMRALEARRVLAAWLDTEGARLVAEAERRHQKGREDLARAERYLADLGHFEARLLCARALGFEGYGTPPKDLDVRLWPGSEEEARARRILETTFDVRPLWRSEADHPGWYEGISVAASPRNNLVASVGGDGELHLWDALSGKRVGGWTVGSNPRALAFSPDGTRLAGAGGGFTIWSVPDGRGISAARLGLESVEAVAWHPDGVRLAVGDSHGGVSLWDSRTGARIFRTVVHGGFGPRHLAFLPDGRFVSTGADETAILWDSESGAAVWTMTLGSDPEGLAVAGGRIYLATGAGLSEVDPDSGKERIIHREIRLALSPHPDGKRMFAVSAEGPKLLSLEDGAVLWSGPEPVSASNRIVAAAGGTRLVGTAGSHLVCWDGETGRLLTPVRGHTSDVRQVAFLPGGLRFASLDAQDRLLMWDALPPRVLWEVREGVKGFAVSADGSAVFLAKATGVGAAKAADGSALWDVRFKSGARKIAMLPDGTVAAACGDQVRVFDPGTGMERRAFPARAAGGLAVSPDGTLLACLDKVVSLHELSTGRRLWMRTWEVAAESMVFHPDGGWLGVGLCDGTIRRASLFAGDELPALRAHKGSVHALAVFPDGGALASAAGDSSIVLWNLEVEPPEAKVRVQVPQWVRALGMSPDSKTMLTGSVDSEVWMWCTPRTRESRILRDSVAGAFQNAALDFSPEGRRVATPVPRSDEILIRDADTGRRVRRLPTRTAALRDFAWCGPSRMAALGRSVGVLLDAENGGELFRIEGAEGIAGSPDGRRAAFSTKDALVVVDAHQGRELVRLTGSGASEWAGIGFAGPDRLLATDVDGRAFLWSIPEAKVVGGFQAAYGRLWDVAVDPAGSVAAFTVARNRSIELRRLPDGAIVRSLECSGDLSGRLAFSQDGGRLASVDEGTLRIWDVGTGRERAAYALSHANVVRFRPGSQELASTGTDGLVRFWESAAGRPDLSASLATHEIDGVEVRPRRGGGASLLNGPEPAAPPYLPESLAGLALRLSDPAALKRASCFTVMAQGDADGAAEVARTLDGAGAQDIRLAVAFDLLIGARRSGERGAWRIGHRRLDAARALGLKVSAPSQPLFEGLLAGKLEGLDKLLPQALVPADQRRTLKVCLALRSGDPAAGTKVAQEELASRSRWDDPDFRVPILECLAGKITAEQLLEQADQEPVFKRRARGEALYFLGLAAKAGGDAALARTRFEEASMLLLPASLEGELARRELSREH